jgi:flagellar assembly factor FliW
MSTLTVESSRFGTLEIDAATAIEFPAGLIGLGGRSYVLLSKGDDQTFSWLQSVEDPQLALPVTNPWLFFPDYAVELSEEDTERVATDPESVDVWVTVRAGAQLSDFCANLRAPILVAGGLGHQVINEAPGLSVRAALFAEPALSEAAA